MNLMFIIFWSIVGLAYWSASFFQEPLDHFVRHIIFRDKLLDLDRDRSQTRDNNGQE